MNKLIYTFALILIVSYLAPASYAGEIPRNLIANDIHSDAHPSNARIHDATHHFEVYIRNFDLSDLIIEVPKGIKIDAEKNIDVTNQLNQKIESKVSINDRKITLSFLQSIPAGTTLSIKLGNVTTSNSQAENWLYHISAKIAKSDNEIPLGVREIKTYR